MTINVPRFKDRQYKKDANDKLCENDAEWTKSIVKKALFYSNKRAVLITTGSIEDANTIKDALAARIGQSKRRIRTFIKGRTDEESESLKENMCQGDILIGTMLIARGVDMNPADDVLDNGGLAHITAFPPRNNRVEEQVAGRVARKGQPGSGCLIIRKSDVKRLISDGGGCQNEEWSDSWENWRDKREALVADQLTFFLQNRIPILSFRDELYKRMCGKMGDVRSICEEEEDYCQYAAVQIQELWSFWINRFDHEIAALIEEGKNAGKTVTDVLDKPTKDGFFRQFDGFIASKIGKLKEFVADPSKTELLENPAYLMKTAHLMLNSENPEIAREMIKKVDPNDPEFAHIRLYYEAKAHVELGHKLFLRHNKRRPKNRELHEKARKCLEEAVKIVDNKMASIMGVLAVLSIKPSSRLSKQFHRNIEALNIFRQQCLTSIDTIMRIDQQNVGVAKIKDCVEIDDAALKYKKEKKEKQQKSAATEPPRTANPSGPDDPPPDEPAVAEDGNGDDDIPIPTDALEAMKDAGLSHFYNLDIAMPIPSWWTIGLLLFAGVVQFVIGSAMVFGTGPLAAKWGWSLIRGGWDDVKTSLTMAFDRKGKTAQAFSWAGWFAKKVVHYGKVLLGMLAKVLASKFPAVDKFFKFCGLSTDDAPTTALTRTPEITKQITKQIFKVTVLNEVPRMAQKGLTAILPEDSEFCKYLEKNPNFAQNIQMGVGLVTDTVVDMNAASIMSKKYGHTKGIKRCFGRRYLKREVAFGCQMGQKALVNKYRESRSKKRAKKEGGNFWSKFGSHLLEETVSETITSDLITNATVNSIDKAVTHVIKEYDPEYKIHVKFSEACKESGMTSAQACERAEQIKKENGGKRKAEEYRARMQKKTRKKANGAKGKRNGAKEEEKDANGAKGKRNGAKEEEKDAKRSKKQNKKEESKAKRAEEAQQACNNLTHPTASNYNDLAKAFKNMEEEIEKVMTNAEQSSKAEADESAPDAEQSSKAEADESAPDAEQSPKAKADESAPDAEQSPKAKVVGSAPEGHGHQGTSASDDQHGDVEQIVSLNAADPSLQNLNHLSPEIAKAIQFLIANQSSNAQAVGSAPLGIFSLIAADSLLENSNNLPPEIVKVIQYLIAKQSSNAQSSGSATKERGSIEGFFFPLNWNIGHLEDVNNIAEEIAEGVQSWLKLSGRGRSLLVKSVKNTVRVLNATGWIIDGYNFGEAWNEKGFMAAVREGGKIGVHRAGQMFTVGLVSSAAVAAGVPLGLAVLCRIAMGLSTGLVIEVALKANEDRQLTPEEWKKIHEDLKICSKRGRFRMLS
uniref:SECA_MOTOR_DEAD domain-containing protein n=1 Tax=Globodera pallida TaxID=36090 RepID=A0A183CLY9_GLOPA